MNSSPRPYLNVTRRALTQRGISRTSSCSTFTHSTGPMPSGKSNVSGSENGGVVYQSRPRSHTTGGFRHSSIVVQMENDGREVVAVDGEVRAVAHAALVDLAEQVVLRVPGEDVRQARLHAHAHEREPSGALPVGRLGELLVAELEAGQRVRLCRVRLRQRHRHVHVVRAGGEAGVEDGHDEARVDRVQDVA